METTNSICQHTSFPHCKERCKYLEEIIQARDYYKEKYENSQLIMELATKKILELEEKNQILKNENEKLKQELLRIKRKRFKPKKRRKNNKKRGAPIGHKGVSRERPTVVHKYKDIYPKKCIYCHSKKIRKCKSFKEHFVEEIEIRKIVTSNRIHFGYCLKCKKTFYPKEQEVIPKITIGPFARTIATYFRYKRVPYRVIQEIFEELFDMKISHVWVLNEDRKIMKNGLKIYNVLRDKIRNSEYVHGDDTGWKIDGVGKFLWVFISKDTVIYQIRNGRGKKEVESVLGKEYGGCLIMDFLPAFNKFKAKKKQRCLSHLLRDIKEIENNEKLKGKDKDFCNKLKSTLEEMLKVYYQEFKMGKITKEELCKLREKFAIQLTEAIMINPLNNKKIENIRARIIKHNNEILTFLEDPDIEPTNNIAERMLREPVTMRKIIYGNRAKDGAKNFTVILSILQTAKLRKFKIIDVFFLLVTDPQKLLYLLYPP